MMYQQGAVVLVDLEPTVGSEQGFKRPCIIVSDEATITSSHSKLLYVIIPLTRSDKLTGKLAPRLVARDEGLPMDSTALIMHIRSIDPSRIIKKVTDLNQDEFKLVRDGLQILFAL
jgi:mRNA interferase MazF